jgi:hypothetical protein
MAVGIVSGWLLVLFTAMAGAQSDSVDVSSYPAEMQRTYRTFTSKCSRCHALSRPLGARYGSPQQWRDLIRRMARLPGAAISPADQEEIHKFLVFYAEARDGKRTAPGSPEPAKPEPRRGSDAPPPAPAAATRDGIRIEATVREPQPVRRLREGRWVEEAPAGEATLYLAVRVTEEKTSERLPYAEVRARIVSASAEASFQSLVPAFGPEGFHYGANLAAPPGRVRLEVTIAPPPVALVGGTTPRLAQSITVALELDR